MSPMSAAPRGRAGATAAPPATPVQRYRFLVWHLEDSKAGILAAAADAAHDRVTWWSSLYESLTAGFSLTELGAAVADTYWPPADPLYATWLWPAGGDAGTQVQFKDFAGGGDWTDIASVAHAAYVSLDGVSYDGLTVTLPGPPGRQRWHDGLVQLRVNFPRASWEFA